MSRPLFRPTPAPGRLPRRYRAHLRSPTAFVTPYQVIEQSAAVGIACEGSGANWLCANRRTAIALFTPEAFGIVALGSALLNLLRPSVIFWGLALLAGGAGIVLYNTALSALAAAMLIAQPGAARARSKLNAKSARAAANHSACQLPSVSFQTMKMAHNKSAAAAIVSARPRAPTQSRSHIKGQQRERQHGRGHRRKREIAIARIERQRERRLPWPAPSTPSAKARASAPAGRGARSGPRPDDSGKTPDRTHLGTGQGRSAQRPGAANRESARATGPSRIQPPMSKLSTGTFSTSPYRP